MSVEQLNFAGQQNHELASTQPVELQAGVARDVHDALPYTEAIDGMMQQSRSASAGCSSGSSRCGQSRSSHINLENA